MTEQIGTDETSLSIQPQSPTLAALGLACLRSFRTGHGFCGGCLTDFAHHAIHLVGCFLLLARKRKVRAVDADAPPIWPHGAAVALPPRSAPACQASCDCDDGGEFCCCLVGLACESVLGSRRLLCGGGPMAVEPTHCDPTATLSLRGCVAARRRTPCAARHRRPMSSVYCPMLYLHNLKLHP